MSERLSQAEIDALLNQSAPAQPQGLEEQVKVDIIGEVWKYLHVASGDDVVFHS